MGFQTLILLRDECGRNNLHLWKSTSIKMIHSQNVYHCTVWVFIMILIFALFQFIVCVRKKGRTTYQVSVMFHVPAGSEIALSWSPMRLKILHWRPEFHNWLPHFSIWRLKNIFHSPVGACRKKLISDPDQSLIISDPSSLCHETVNQISSASQ